MDTNTVDSAVSDPFQKLKEFQMIVRFSKEKLGSANIVGNEDYPLPIRQLYRLALDNINALDLAVAAHLVRLNTEDTL